MLQKGDKLNFVDKDGKSVEGVVEWAASPTQIAEGLTACVGHGRLVPETQSAKVSLATSKQYGEGYDRIFKQKTIQ